jgi:GT2 family glycosyltransferase
LFDECFLNGEDGELSWRTQKHGGFAIRYNEGAVVFHRHPATVRNLLTRAYREGTGLSRFRVKHRLDFSARAISLQHYRVRLAITAAGLGLYPLRLIRCMKEGMPLRRSLLYPLLDKGCALAREMGVLLGLSRQRAPRK